MHHTGTLYMSKQLPVTGTERDGSFRLELVLVDNMGRNPFTGKEDRETYRVRWAGPEAQAFWAAHQADLTSGTPLRAELQRLRGHVDTSIYPPRSELQCRAKNIEMVPKRSPAQREQLSNQEQADSVSA